MFLYRYTHEGGKKTNQVFGRGLLDTLDDVFWMLPFSSKKQADLVRQENDIADDIWERRRKLIFAENRTDEAREHLTNGFKAWISRSRSAGRQQRPDSPQTTRKSRCTTINLSAESEP